MWRFFRPATSQEWPRVVASVPPSVAQSIQAAVSGIAGTYETLERMFRSARRSLKVFCPYVDPTFSALACAATVPVAIVTTAREGRRPQPNPVLERLAACGRAEVRYLVQRRRGAQLFQMHAKMVLCDRQVAYVGSANLTDTSLRHNLELGLLVTEPRVVDVLDRLFEHVFGNLAVPSGHLV